MEGETYGAFPVDLSVLLNNNNISNNNNNTKKNNDNDNNSNNKSINQSIKIKLAFDSRETLP